MIQNTICEEECLYKIVILFIIAQKNSRNLEGILQTNL